MILRRYLMLDTFKSQISILFVLFLIFISQSFIKILGKAIDGTIPSEFVFKILYLNIPVLATLMFPISFFLAVLFALGRLHSESEIVAMTSCGYSPNKILKSILLLSLFTFAIASFNSLYLAPLAEDQIIETLENAESTASTSTLIEGRFHKVAGIGGVVYIEEFDDSTGFKKVFISHWPKKRSQAPSILTSQTGSVEKRTDGTWVTLNDGQRYAGIIGQNVFDITHFQDYQIHIEDRKVKNRTREVYALPTSQLMKLNTFQSQAELQWRIVVPVSILMLTFLAVPLAKVSPRQGKYTKLLPAVSIYLSFFLCLSSAKSMIEDGTSSPIAIWLVLLLFFIGGLVLHMQTLGKFTVKKNSNDNK